MGSHTTTRRDKGWSYYHAKRKQSQWHVTTFVLIALGVLAALWQAVNGSGWERVGR